MNRPNFFITILISFSNFLLAQNSVLSSGNWYKTGVTRDGVHRLNYADLQNLGINPAGIDPRNIRLYGNGGGMLPELNSEPRAVDLVENAITVIGEGDGVFDAGDYILFYGQSPHQWKFNVTSQRFEHGYNIYSETTYYFITTDLGLGKRMVLQSSSLLPSTDTVTTFDDYAFHETELINFIQSGREWYGEQFDSATINRNFSFSFPNIATSDSVYIGAKFAARSTDSLTAFIISANGQQIFQKNLARVCPDYTCPFASTSQDAGSFISSQSQINVSINFSSTGTSTKGWLDNIELNARRNLVFTGSQLQFRDARNVGSGRVSEVYIINTVGNLSVWDVTNPQNAKLQETFANGLLISTRVTTDSLKEFIAFDGSSFLSPQLLGVIPNQNLHGLGSVSMLIVTHPDFLPAANRLANHHRSFDGLSVEVATTEQVYNEFSSGSQDITALRDFAKMMYLNPNPDSLKYLLLFGDASYDYKNRIPGNGNFVPTYQSQNSLSVTSSFFTDDYFGLLDSADGNPLTSLNALCAGIGRLPIKTLAEANGVVDKIIHYTSVQTLGKWRKETVFIGDDEDVNVHMTQSNQLATLIDDNYCDYHVNKIFLDDYPETVGSLGNQTYPDVNNAIYDKVHEGALVANYTGAANEFKWAHENILDSADIANWSNVNRMPLIIAATAEVVKLDDPTVVSIGEVSLLSQNGGSIACFGGSRLVYSGANYAINYAFMQHIFEPVNGEMPRLGDIVKSSKSAIAGDVNNRKMVLIGDPALRLAYPEEDIAILTVNGNSVSSVPDSLFASSTATITGRIEDQSGSLLSNFNGMIYADLFDKQKEDSTLGNSGATRFPFLNWRSPVLTDSTQVQNGLFTLILNIPSGTDSSFGFGKLSLYASNGVTDASGCHTNFLIGGGNQTITALRTIDGEVEFMIYPLPVVGQAMVEVKGFSPHRAVFSLYDDTGREVKRMENISENKFSFSSESLAKGVYVFTFRDETNSYSKSGKLMVH